MKWEGLNLHIENLLPGLASLVLLIALLPDSFFNLFSNTLFKEIINKDFVAAGFFLSMAYIFGVICVAVSRLAVDRLSEAYPRPLLLKYLSRGFLKNKTNKEINKIYRSYISIALHSEKTEIINEVTKRRERGRMARTAFVPSLLLAILISKNYGIFIIAPVTFLSLASIVFIYAYIEVTIYEETLLVVKNA